MSSGPLGFAAAVFTATAAFLATTVRSSVLERSTSSAGNSISTSPSSWGAGLTEDTRSGGRAASICAASKAGSWALGPSMKMK